MYETSSAGVVGILSSITLPSTILILYLNLFYRVVSFKSFKGLVTIIASLLIVIDSFLKSSFLYIVVYFLLVLFSIILKKNYIDNKKFEIKLFLFIPVFGILICYFAYIYQFRIYDIDYVLYDRNIIPNKSFNNYFDFTIINFVHYMLHGYYQWVDLYNIVGLNNYSYGFIQFYPIVKFFKSFVYSGLPSMLELLSVLPKELYIILFGGFHT